MGRLKAHCDACAGPSAGKLTSLRIEGRVLRLCPRHVAALAGQDPATLEQAASLLGSAPLDRRVDPDRRGDWDRRMFARPETRRASQGRRASDEPR